MRRDRWPLLRHAQCDAVGDVLGVLWGKEPLYAKHMPVHPYLHVIILACARRLGSCLYPSSFKNRATHLRRVELTDCPVLPNLPLARFPIPLLRARGRGLRP